MDDSYDRFLKVKKSCNIAPGVVDLSVIEDEDYVKGGILSNNKQSWVSCGSRITNLNNNNGSKRTGWTFGWASGDKTIRVVCVEELTAGSTTSPVLVVACDSDTNGSSLCFYHSGRSRLLKAVHFHDKITSLAVVSKSNESHEQENLSEFLNPWNGVVAVGTNVGKVYLVDVWWTALERCIEDYRQKLYDEQRQSKLLEVTVKDLDNDFDCRTTSIRHGSSTLALWLNELTFERGRVGAHPGLHNILGRMPLEFISVSVLKYFPQIATLAVGYNTSCFQLWDLSTLTLLYTSALLEAMLPVYSFSLLEPSDDPRYVCYLWSLHHSVDEDNIPFAGMYIISYHEKHLKPYSNQYLYEGYASCSIRYQLDLGADMSDVDIASGRIISCQSIHRSLPKLSSQWINTDSEETGGEEGTASLLSIAWEVWTPNQLSVYRKLTLFDLNQWYREYMPTSSDMEYSQFMAHFCLPDGQLLDVKVIPSSVKQFQALQPLDEHFYPTATTFDCLVLNQNQLVVCSHVGVQQEALETLSEAGPSGLLLPACLYKQCTQAGLRPLLVDIGSPSTLHSSDQRAYLLCVALENECTQYLRQCVVHWADGSHAVAGCTLPALLGWAWDRVQRYKKWLDRLCVPLFDYTGTALDTNDLGIFHHMVCQFHRLRDLFHLVLDKYGNCIIKGNFEQQYTVINLVAAFYDSIFWCVRNKVLPEVNASEDNLNSYIPYFTDKIINATISRRAELHHLAKGLQDAAPAGLLLVDAVVAQEAGARVTDQWEREGGSATLGKYPPASVQSLLRTYLIRNVPAHVKHFIVTYFLLDVAHVVSSLGASDAIKHKLLKYPTNFGLTESQSKIVEAFWCLDHQQFQAGVKLLLDSCVCKEDLQVYQHRTVLCLLAAVGEHKLALRYLTTRRRTPTEPQDVRMEMTLLLTNDLIHEAFQLQRHHQSMSTELLEQFFKGCVEMNKLDVVFKLALTPAEEEAFMCFLDNTSHPQADDLRVLYLLSRSRYVEAIDMNEKLHNKIGGRRGMGLSPAPGARKVRGGGVLPTKTITTRDLIINSVCKSLPSITRDLADYCHREKHFSWKQINRPKPLSVVVHTELSKDRLPYYKTSDTHLMQAAVSKTREIWAPLLATPAALKRKLQPSVEDTPFLRNTIHSRLNSSVTNIEEVRSGVRGRSDDLDLKVSKRARLEFSPSEKNSTQTETSVDKTSDMDITCPLSIAVLHTPLVAKIVKKAPREIHTPQSILKGRSGPNTPLTPARDRLGSPAVMRQIRFSLPQEDSPSPTKSEEELHSDEGEYLKTSLSPRKSIHETSDLHSRLPTPSNPRVLQKPISRPLRSSATQLQFDETEPPNNEGQPELSSTAVALLKNISSPPSSEESYFSFQSTSSGVENSKSDNESKLKITYGLEGNMESREDDFAEDFQQDQTYREDHDTLQDVSVVSDVSQDMETTITPSKSIVEERKSVVFADQANESVHFTLEYKGDTSSSLHMDSRHLPPSSPRNTELEFTHDQCDTMNNQEFEVINSYKQETKQHVEKKKIEEKPVLKYSLPSVKGDELTEQDDDIKIIEGIASEAPHEPSLLLAIQTEPNEIETGKIEVPLDSSLSLASEREVTQQYIDNSKTIFEEKSDPKGDINTTLLTDISSKLDNNEVIIDQQTMQDFTIPSVTSLGSAHKELIADDTLTSEQNLECAEQENGDLNLDNRELQLITQDTSLGSVRASTPLPQILEELVKRGRISLSIPESEVVTESNLQSEQFSSTTADENTTICVPSEEAVIVEDVKNSEKMDSASHKEIYDGGKSSNLDASLNMPSEKDIVHEKKESFLSVPTKGSSKQMFVFGNQDSFSTSAVNSNLTFTIGTNVFGTSTWEDAAVKSDKPSSDKSYSSTVDETEARDIEEISIVSQNCSTSEEPNKSTNNLSQNIISHAHSLATNEEACKDKPRDEKICENIKNNVNVSEISKVFTSESPEDGQIEILDFYVDTASNNIKQLEADSSENFELKMSEGESVNEVSHCENNYIALAEEVEANKESVFHTLKPVQYGVDMEDDLDEYNNYENTTSKEDVDIYEDLEELDNDGGESVDEHSSNKEEEEEEEVICLESSSDEESPTKEVKSPTSYNPTPKTANRSKFGNETLDYELEEEDDENDQIEEEFEEEYDDQEQGRESYSSESSLDDDNAQSENESDSKIEKKNLYFSSESESDTSHHRRSWKEQRKQYDSNESLSKENAMADEDTVESPPFEIIGQDSQEGYREEHSETVKETEEKSLEFEADITCNPTLLANSSVEQIAEVKENKIMETSLDPNQSVTNKTSDKDKIADVEKDVIDFVKLAEENRQRRLETGSILDLKERRNKRYSSVPDLSESNKKKLRRRSCSQHDIMSALIKEAKSASHLSPTKELLITDSSSVVNKSQVSSPSHNTITNEILDSSSVQTMPPLKTQESISSDIEFSETASMSSSLIPEVGSVISNQSSIYELPISKGPWPLDNPKRKVKSIVSTLHDISEENADISDSFKSSPQDQTIRKSLRRSVSTDQLPASKQIDLSRSRRSSSVCRWNEYRKSHESEIPSNYCDTTDVRSSLGDSHKPDNFTIPTSAEMQKMKHPTIKSKQKVPATSYLNSDEVEETIGSTNEPVPEDHKKETEHDSVKAVCSLNGDTSQFADVTVQSTDNSRMLRAQSEPLTITQPSSKSRRIRKSVSSQKINQINKSISYRSSLKGKSFGHQEFQIIDSDAESSDKESQGQENAPRKKDQSELLENHFVNVQVEVTTDTHEPVVTSNEPGVTSNEPVVTSNEPVVTSNEPVVTSNEPVVTSNEPIVTSNVSTNSEGIERTKRGHSEPPTANVDSPKTRSRTRRSSTSCTINKVLKLVNPRQSRNIPPSSSQYHMEIVHSDEETSVHKTPDQVKKYSTSELEHQYNEDINETPVTSKKLSKSKIPPKTAIEVTRTNESLPSTQVANRTTQHYPQLPKKRGRTKSNPEEETSDPSIKSGSGLQDDVIEDKVQESEELAQPHTKKQRVKNLKSGQQVKGTRTDSANEPDSLKTVELGKEASDKNVGEGKTIKPKKRKDQSTLNVDSSERDNILASKSQECITKVNEKSRPRKKKVVSNKEVTPKKTRTIKKKETATPPNQQTSSENSESSLTESQAHKISKPIKINKYPDLSILDSPASRTRRSMSRLSDTEALTPTIDKPQRRTRRSSIKSDIVLSTPNKYAESEISDASTELNLCVTHQTNTPSKSDTPSRRSSRRAGSEISDVSTELSLHLNTPTRRSTRRPSISATPNTPELTGAEDLLKHRRLTRHQHSQLQKSFDLSFAESPKLPRLEEVPEESVEHSDLNITPVRSSKRTKTPIAKGSKSKPSKK